ncbi:sugar phosphate isomerase/epimerase family protein [Paludisphaera borealis]|uniref:Inosose isomerase n=1 Tax=Paludisphaera borealis TaxID=1387353 RepID=A0A1U7CM31_9BACT|nr:TIM barrel protein [Paludisphaera borealis]APW59995.1 Inosose isomerase [Paludisphaera borealis]
MYACWSARAVGLDLPAEATIEVAAKAGFEGVDFMVRDLVEAGANVDGLRSRMDDLNLRGGAWVLPMNWKNDHEAFESDLKRLPIYAAAAERLGLARTGTWVRFETDPVADLDRISRADRERLADEATAWQLDRLGRIARILDDHGSRLGLEFIGSQAAPTGRGVRLVGTYTELRQRFGRLAAEHPNVGVLVDAFHIFAAGETVDDALTGGVESVVWVHLADPTKLDRASLRDEERTLPGESGTGLSESLLETLATWGYDGPVTVEPLGRCSLLERLDPLETALKTRKSLRRIWPGSDHGPART